MVAENAGRWGIVRLQYVREHMTLFAFGTVRIEWLKPVLPFYSRALTDAPPMDWSEGHSVYLPRRVYETSPPR
jgi:hypothetical protein